MYSETAIEVLEKRIGWNEALDSDFAVAISDENKEKTSGKHFQSFHQLVTVENLYAAVPTVSLDVAKFNAKLADIRKQAVLFTLGSVLDANAKYVDDQSYDSEILAKVRVFDDAIGLKVAQSVLEYFMSSERKNLENRNAKLAIGNLKLELEGYRNDKGTLIAVGLNQKLQVAIRQATKRFFPVMPTIEDASDKW